MRIVSSRDRKHRHTHHQAGPQTGTGTGTGTGTSTCTCTDTSTDTCADTSTDTSTSTGAGKGTDTRTGTCTCALRCAQPLSSASSSWTRRMVCQRRGTTDSTMLWRRCRCGARRPAQAPALARAHPQTPKRQRPPAHPSMRRYDRCACLWVGHWRGHAGGALTRQSERHRGTVHPPARSIMACCWMLGRPPPFVVRRTGTHTQSVCGGRGRGGKPLT
jgi:hypothetical protein